MDTEASLEINQEKSVSQKKWSTSNKILSGVLLLIMWIIMAFNTQNADYYAYSVLYNGIAQFGMDFSSDSIEPGFRAVMYVCTFISSQYQIFLLIISTVLLSALLYVIRLFTTNVFLVLFLFFIFGFTSQAIQVRMFSALIFILLAFYHLTKLRGSKAIFKYIFFILVAGLFHNLAYFYLPFFIVKINKKITGYVTILSLLLFSIGQSYISSIFINTKYDAYFDGNSTSISHVVMFALFFSANLFLVHKLSKMNIYEKKVISLSSYIFSINMLASTSIVFLLISNNFIRIIQNIFVLNYIIYASVLMSNYKRTKVKNYIYLLAYFFFIIVCLIFINIRGTAFVNGILPLFRENIIFKAVYYFFE